MQTEIVRDDDPRCAELELEGYVVVGESWGARLRLPQHPDLSLYDGIIAEVESSGITVRELGPEYADAVLALETANNADYPYTPATHQPPPTAESIAQLWTDGKRVFAALDGDLVVGVVVGELRGDVGDNDFASVLAAYRSKRIGAAVAAAFVSTFAREGARTFTAGGAAVNDASMGLARSLGFAIEERWRSYQRPPLDL